MQIFIILLNKRILKIILLLKMTCQAREKMNICKNMASGFSVVPHEWEISVLIS